MGFCQRPKTSRDYKYLSRETSKLERRKELDFRDVIYYTLIHSYIAPAKNSPLRSTAHLISFLLLSPPSGIRRIYGLNCLSFKSKKIGASFRCANIPSHFGETYAYVTYLI